MLAILFAILIVVEVQRCGFLDRIFIDAIIQACPLTLEMSIFSIFLVYFQQL